MKTILIIVASVFAMPGLVFSNDTENNENIGYLLQDYIIVSKWDASTGSWVNSTKQVAVYDFSNKLIASVVINAQTNDTISKTRTISASQGDATIQYYQEWKDGIWVDIRYMLTEYDELHRRSAITTYQLIDNEWIHTARQYNLTYNELNKLESFESQYWIDNGWKTNAIDYYEYDESGDLVHQIRELLPFMYSYQAFYTYNNHRMMTRLVQGWQKTTGGWINNYRDTYSYNSCGTRLYFIRERYIGGVWVNEQKTEYFYKLVFPEGEKKMKVPVCHNGQTIYVSVNAAGSHLAHGDCIGECLKDKKDLNNAASINSENVKAQFIIYPNPAREMITIRFEQQESGAEIKRIELTDFYGKIIKIYNINNQTELTIPRGNLLPGKYYVRMIGKEVISQVIIFE